jgi:hypothetical protein
MKNPQMSISYDFGGNMHGRVSRPEPRTPSEIAQAILASQQMIEETYHNSEEFTLAGWSAEAARAYHARRIKMLRQRMNSVEGANRRSSEQVVAQQAKIVRIAYIVLLLVLVAFMLRCRSRNIFATLRFVFSLLRST